MGFPFLRVCSGFEVSRYVSVVLSATSYVFTALCGLVFVMGTILVSAKVLRKRPVPDVLLFGVPEEQQPGCGKKAALVVWVLTGCVGVMYCVFLGLYWSAVLFLERVSSIEVPFPSAAQTLFVFFNLAPLVTLIGSLASVMLLWRSHLRDRLPFLDGCVVHIAAFLLLLIPLVFYLLLSVFMWLADDAFSVGSSESVELSCAFFLNSTYLAETPFVVRASCCAVSRWGFASWICALLLFSVTLLWWVPSAVYVLCVGDSSSSGAVLSGGPPRSRTSTGGAKRQLFAEDERDRLLRSQ